MLIDKISDLIFQMVMLPDKIPFEKTEEIDRRRGFDAAFDDYHNKWTKTATQVTAIDGIIIDCEYIVNPGDLGKRKKVAVVCHGQTVTRAGAIKYAKIFYDRGYNIVLFDQRYFGKSGGDYCTLGWMEAEDIKKVIKLARLVFGEDCFLGLHGESMGAGSALRLLDTERPDFVVADCPFADTGLLIDDLARKRALFLAKPAEEHMRKRGLKLCGYDFRAVQPINSVAKSNVPICFMHGAEDKLINLKHSRMMYEKSKNPLSEIHIFSKTDHALSIVNHKEMYDKYMNDFIGKIEKTAGL